MIGVPSQSSTVYVNLINDGYADVDIPSWVLRPAQEKARISERMSQTPQESPQEVHLSDHLSSRSKTPGTPTSMGQGANGGDGDPRT